LIHRLEFLNNVHALRATNLTVRNGLKWSKQVEPCDIVNIAKTGDSPTFQARILAVTTCQFCYINAIANLAFEHDPSCRTILGLLACMKQTYPGFKFTDVVTLLYYEIVDAKDERCRCTNIRCGTGCSNNAVVDGYCRSCYDHHLPKDAAE
jgi:hypothetical protein